MQFTLCTYILYWLLRVFFKREKDDSIIVLSLQYNDMQFTVNVIISTSSFD